MPNADNKRPVGDFDAALQLLDHELGKLDLGEPLPIRAIGGYALLKHGVRADERALTVDIDTVTRDYSAAVIEAIRAVADLTGLDPDWINNTNLGFQEPEDVELTYDAEWLPQDTGLKHIDLAIGSVATLTRSKIMAVDAAAVSGRLQDAPDLLALLKHQGITRLAQFRSRYPDPFDEYPETQRLVKGYFSAQVNRPDAKPRSSTEAIRKWVSERVMDLDYEDEGPETDYER